MALVLTAKATRVLTEHGGYDWLIQGKAFWSVNEVVRALSDEGVKISNDTIAKWFKTLPHTQDFGGPVGLRASRNDLVLMFVRQMHFYTSEVLDEEPSTEPMGRPFAGFFAFSNAQAHAQAQDTPNESPSDGAQ